MTKIDYFMRQDCGRFLRRDELVYDDERDLTCPCNDAGEEWYKYGHWFFTEKEMEEMIELKCAGCSSVLRVHPKFPTEAFAWTCPDCKEKEKLPVTTGRRVIL